MLQGYQIRAARGFLDWSRSVLATKAKISPETIRNAECGVFNLNPLNEEKIIHTFEAAGLVFVDGGVRQKSPCSNCKGELNAE